MQKWDEIFPYLGLCRNKGYGTDEHVEALKTHGPTLLHRFSFEPVRNACPYPIWAGYDQPVPPLFEEALRSIGESAG
jgi:hypothetical protein